MRFGRRKKLSNKKKVGLVTASAAAAATARGADNRGSTGSMEPGPHSRLSTKNPKHTTGTTTADDVEQIQGKEGIEKEQHQAGGRESGTTLVCGIDTGTPESGVQLVKSVLASSAFKVKLSSSDSLRDDENCERVILVASKTVLSDKHTRVQEVLATATSKHIPVYVLVETDETNHGGMSVPEWIDYIPKKFKALKGTECVPLYRDTEYLPASIQTILNQHGGAAQDLADISKFDCFLSHHQLDAQGNCMALYVLLEQMGFKVWFDMMARDLSTTGMIRGVAKSDNFVLFVTRDTFNRPFCVLEIQEAVKLKKKIIVIYEERERFGGLALEQHLKNVPEEFKFLRDYKDKYGWLVFNTREEFRKTMLSQLLQLCDLNAPTKEMLSLFESVHNSFRREAVPRRKIEDFQPGTRQWMFDAVDTWQASANPQRAMFILGQAGVGKSVFAAEIVRKGNAEVGFGASDNSVVAYHFFQHDYSRLSSARNCLLSISAQMRKNIPGFREAFDANSRDTSDATTQNWTLLQYFQVLIAEPACAVKSWDRETRALVVVDALDECTKADRNELARILKVEWPIKTPAWLSLIATARPSVIAFPRTPEQTVEQGLLVLNTEDKQNMHDVKLYLRECVFHDRVNPAQLDDIVERVAKMSEGLFLYLRFLNDVITNILSNTNRTLLVKSDLKQFPNGLGEIFAKYFQRMYNELGEVKYGALLASVVAAREPVPKQLWIQASSLGSSVEGKKLTGKAARIAARKARTEWTNVEQLCTNLLHIPSTLDGAGGVRFVHKSMVDWLTGEAEDSGQGETALRDEEREHLHIDVEDGHEALAKVCNQAFWTSVKRSNTTTTVSVDQFVAKHTFYHLCLDGKLNSASKLLFTLDALLQRLKHDSPNQMALEVAKHFNMLNADDEAEPDVKQLIRQARVVANVLRLGNKALDGDPRQLAGQIVGRLSVEDVDDGDLASVKQLREQAWAYKPSSEDDGTVVRWLRPSKMCLESAMPSPLIRSIYGHGNAVNSVAFSPDDNTIISGSNDNTVRLWDAKTGESRLGGKALNGHTEMVSSVAFAPDGKTIVSGSWDKTIRLWDAETGEPKWGGMALKGHTEVVTSVAFSRNGTTIASGSWDKTIRLWDAKTGEPKLGGMALEGHPGFVTSVAFSPDSKLIASGSWDKTIRVWDVETGTAMLGGKGLEGHTDDIRTIAFSHDGKTIVSGSNDMTIRLWDVETGTAKLGGEALEGHTGEVMSVAFSRDDKTIVSGCHDNTIRLWDVRTGQAKLGGRALGRHPRGVKSVAFASDGKTIVSGSQDQTIRVWNAQPDEADLGKASEGDTTETSAIVFSPDGTTVVSGSDDKTIRFWDAETGTAKLGGKALKGHTHWVNCLSFSLDGKTLVSGCHDDTIRLWDGKTGEAKLGGVALKEHTNTVTSVAFSPDGKTVVSGSADDTIRVWDVDTGLPKLNGKALEGHAHAVTSLSYSPDGKSIVSGSYDKTIRLWDAETGESKLGGMALEGHTEEVSSVAFSPNGKIIVSGSDDMTLRLWDVNTGTAKLGGKTLDGHTGPVKSVIFSPDGKTIMSSDPSTIRLWDVESGQEKQGGASGHAGSLLGSNETRNHMGQEGMTVEFANDPNIVGLTFGEAPSQVVAPFCEDGNWRMCVTLGRKTLVFLQAV